MGDGWSIAIVDSNSYLTIGGGPKHGIPIVASEYPVAWKVENHNNGAFRSVSRLPSILDSNAEPCSCVGSLGHPPYSIGVR